MSHWRVWPPEGRWSFPQLFFSVKFRSLRKAAPTRRRLWSEVSGNPKIIKNPTGSEISWTMLNIIVPKSKHVGFLPLQPRGKQLNEGGDWGSWPILLVTGISDAKRVIELWFEQFLFFHILGIIIHLTHIFQKGRYTTNQLWTLTKPKSFPCHDMTTLL